MRQIHLYFRIAPSPDKYLPGDRYLFNIARKLFRRKRTSGVKKVFDNLCKGLNELKVPYTVNLRFKKIKPTDAVIVLGVGQYALQGYQQPNKIIAGIGLMTHPSEWPNLFKQYPLAKYLQHSAWTNDMYAAHYGSDNCAIWPAGIDTVKWAPTHQPKKYDVLIYNKIMWDKPHTNVTLRQPIINKLNQLHITYREITYGQYTEDDYYTLLQDCRAMLFLCEHESQGFACCEALSMDVPVLAWDQGYWLDPDRFKWNNPVVKATSIPYFDNSCGSSFTDMNDFDTQFNTFWNNVLRSNYHPRAYILQNLTLQKSAQQILDLINNVYS